MGRKMTPQLDDLGSNVQLYPQCFNHCHCALWRPVGRQHWLEIIL